MDTTILTSVSTSPSRFDAGLAAKERMKKIGLNKIFIAPVAPLGLRSPSRPPVGAVNDPIPPRIGQRAASEIGAWPDSGAAKTLHRAAQVLETAAANARISAEAPDPHLLRHLDLTPRPALLLEPLEPHSAVLLQLLCAAVVA